MTVVVRVEASDADSLENGQVVYHLLMDDTQQFHFGINSRTGDVFLRQALDRELQKEYSFLVVAMDRGTVRVP